MSYIVAAFDCENDTRKLMPKRSIASSNAAENVNSASFFPVPVLTVVSKFPYLIIYTVSHSKLRGPEWNGACFPKG